MVPTLIVTSPIEKHRRSLSTSSTGLLELSTSLLIPNWRERLDTISPRRASPSPFPRLRLPLVLATCALIILLVSRTGPLPIPYTASRADLLAFRPIPSAPKTDDAWVKARLQGNASEEQDAELAPVVAIVLHGRLKGAHKGVQRLERSLEGRSKKACARKAAKKATAKHAVVKSTSATSSKHAKATHAKKHPHATYYTKTYSGVATHFPGSAAALACGDVYDSPATTKFAALCHTTFDAAPGSSAVTRLNPNKSPACGPWVSGRKDLTGAWTSKVKNALAYVTVGGDGQLSCVGTAGVMCHTPRTISITRGGRTVSGVQVVDRNQGLAPSPCASGDVDVSDLVYTTLGDTSVLGSELQDVTWEWET